MLKPETVKVRIIVNLVAKESITPYMIERLAKSYKTYQTMTEEEQLAFRLDIWNTLTEEHNYIEKELNKEEATEEATEETTEETTEEATEEATEETTEEATEEATEETTIIDTLSVSYNSLNISDFEQIKSDADKNDFRIVYAYSDSFREEVKGNILLHIAVIMAKSKVKRLIDNPLTYHPFLEKLRSDMLSIAPYKKVSIFENPLHINIDTDTTNNIGYDVIMQGVKRLNQFSAYGYKLNQHLKGVIPTSKYYSNGNLKDRTLWKYRDTNALRECSIAISKAIEHKRPNNSTPIELEVNGTKGVKYRRSNILEIESGNIDALEVVSKYISLLSAQEAKVFRCLYIKDMTRPETASKLHLTEKAIERTVSRIKEKVIKSGYLTKKEESVKKVTYTEIKKDDGRKVVVPIYSKSTVTYNNLNELKESDTTSKNTVYVYPEEGNKLLYTFASAKEASKVLNVHRSHIQNCLAGKRKTTSGYRFSRHLLDSETGQIIGKGYKRNTELINYHLSLFDIGRKEDNIPSLISENSVLDGLELNCTASEKVTVSYLKDMGEDTETVSLFANAIENRGVSKKDKIDDDDILPSVKDSKIYVYSSKPSHLTPTNYNKLDREKRIHQMHIEYMESKIEYIHDYMDRYGFK